MNAWGASDVGGARQAALFLEDDLEASPLVFRWLEWCLALAAASQKPASELLGCAFHTPRVDELTPTPGTDDPLPWTPEQVLGRAALDGLPVFRMQVPCSWGALWLAAPWARFTAYYRARVRGDAGPPPLALKSHGWWMSWKRYLVEYMALHGAWMVYPAFPEQASFVTNHYEVGVHHYLATDAAQPIPDALRPKPDPRFCVPLLSDAVAVARALPTVAALRARAAACGRDVLDLVPLVGWQHTLVAPAAACT